MIIGLVYEVTKWINIFPVSNLVRDLYSPRTIVTGRKLDCQKNCKIEFRQSVQVHDHLDGLILNSVTNRRTTGGIAIGSFGNLQGGYKFLSLETGRVVTGYKWTIVPISEKIIGRIHELAINQPEDIIFGDDDDFAGVDVHNTKDTNKQTK